MDIFPRESNLSCIFQMNSPGMGNFFPIPGEPYTQFKSSIQSHQTFPKNGLSVYGTKLLLHACVTRREWVTHVFSTCTGTSMVRIIIALSLKDWQICLLCAID